MRFQGAGLLTFLCVLAAAPAGSADDSAAPAKAEFSVLTPSMEGQYFVATQLNLNMLYPLLGGPGDFANQSRTKQLRRIVQADRYDPARTLADRMIEALAEAGYSAVYEPIARRPAGSVQSLSWSDLPEHPQGKLFLDLNIRWICLCSSTSYLKTYPGISISWRLLDPRQDVVIPSRGLVYYHIPWDPPDRKVATSVREPPEPSPYPPVTVSESCGFGSLDEAAKNPTQIWGCLGEAYDVAVERLVIDLKRLRPPTAPVTASADTPS